MKKHRNNIQKLFLSSGCLSEDAILLYLNRNAGDEERKAIEEHLSGCELCTAAVEGYTYLAEEKSAVEIPAIISELKGQISAKVLKHHRKKYIRPLLAMAAMLVIIFASFIIFRMLYTDKEPILAKLSEPEISKEIITDSVDKQIKSVLKPDIQSDGQAIKSVIKRQVTPVNDALEPQMMSPVQAQNEKREQDELINTESEVASKKEVANLNIAGSGNSGMNKSLDISQNDAMPVNKYASKDEEVKPDSTYYLSYDRSYQVNASAPQSHTYISTEIKKSSTNEEIRLAYNEVVPEFPGGSDSLTRFIENNLKYPEKARSLNIRGTVKVSFYVETDGRLTEIKVSKSLGYGCDEEAIRVVKQMPRWISGKQNGLPARMKVIVPVKFSIKN